MYNYIGGKMENEEYIEMLEGKLQEVTFVINELQEKVRALYAEISIKQEQAQSILQLLQFEGHKVEGVDTEIIGQLNISDLAFEYLEDAGTKKPVHYRELASKLLSRGTVITGKDPAANLLSHINRDERFVRTAPGTYGLAKWGLVPMKTRKRRKRRKTKK